MKLEDIKPVGHRILLKTEVVEKVKDLGNGNKLFLMSEKEQKRKQAGNNIHTVVAIGPTAYKDDAYQGETWCKVGDKVLTAQYPGQKLHFEDCTAWFANDEDILAVLKENDDD